MTKRRDDGSLPTAPEAADTPVDLAPLRPDQLPGRRRPARSGLATSASRRGRVSRSLDRARWPRWRHGAPARPAREPSDGLSSARMLAILLIASIVFWAVIVALLLRLT